MWQDPTFETPSDTSLVHAMLAGETEALGQLFDRHAPAVYPLCLRMLRHPAAADELLNDVFYEFWQHRDRFDASRGGVRTYLLMLTRCRGLDRIKAERRRPDRHREEAAAIVAGHIIVDEAQRPEGALVAAEVQAQVREHLQGLSDEQRQCLELAYFDGLSHSEVAAQTQRPLGSVKSAIRRGLQHLRQCRGLAEQLDPEAGS